MDQEIIGENMETLEGVSLSDWDAVAPTAEISVEALDDLVRAYVDARRGNEEYKKAGKELQALEEKLEALVVEALQAARKTNWHVDGLGMVYTSNRYTVRTPKTNQEKDLLFGYIEARYGKQALLSKMGINHNTLQGFYKEEIESLLQQGIPDPSIPGLEAPTHEVTLGLRKE